MFDLGDFRYGETVVIPFSTFNSAGGSVVMSGIAVTDIEVYKGANMVQRASDNGYALIDTDGIDIDGAVGVGGFSVDTADNTTAGFYSPGSRYFIVLNSITVDSQTVRPTFRFSIECGPEPGLLARTTFATLASQVSFTLTAGSADNDAYNGCMLVVQDAASVVQKCVGYVHDYVGSTKTVTLIEDPAVFTMAVGDYIAIYANPSRLSYEEITHPYNSLERINARLVSGVPATELVDKAGMVLSIASRDDVVNAVYDEPKAGHTIAGTYGAELGTLNVKKINDATVLGIGTSGNKWRGE